MTLKRMNWKWKSYNAFENERGELIELEACVAFIASDKTLTTNMSVKSYNIKSSEQPSLTWPMRTWARRA